MQKDWDVVDFLTRTDSDDEGDGFTTDAIRHAVGIFDEGPDVQMAGMRRMQAVLQSHMSGKE